MMARPFGRFAALLGALALGLTLAATGPARAAASVPGGRELPKLVVVLIVDGLPQEQVVKYYDQLVEGGFKRLLGRGAWFTGAHYGHAMTETAVGHATIMTGAHPYRHGLVGNEWFDRNAKTPVYGVEDPQHKYLGEETKAHVGTSPRNLRVTTVGDELRLKTGFRSKVLSISIKDRGAIPSAGKVGTAYWYSGATGRFVTSTYYRNEYPGWWNRFHSETPQDKWFGKAWEPLLPRAAYARSASDDRPYHTNFRKLGTKFPFHVTGGLSKPGREYYEALTWTPFGDEYLAAFVKAAVVGEGLGRNPAGVPDILAVSFSTHDYVNHGFGPESMQSHDHFLRLDRVFADLFKFLDQRVGLANTLVVLTADHGFSNVPEYCAETLKIEAGRIDPQEMLDGLNAHLSGKFGPAKFTLHWRRPTIYLDYDAIDGNGLDRVEVENAAAAFLAAYPGVFSVFTRTQLTLGQVAPTRFWQMVARTWNPELSGDLYVIQKNCWYLVGAPTTAAAMHGGPWGHDTNVPLIFLGPKWIRPGKYAQPVEVVDIAATLAHLLNVRPPDGNEGRVLHEIFAGSSRPRRWPRSFLPPPHTTSGSVSPALSPIPFSPPRVCPCNEAGGCGNCNMLG